jgi:hypothetical protein
MTRRLAALLLLLCPAVATLCAQPKFGPKFTIEGGKAFDFGELRTIAPVTRDLRITNTGTDTLRIRDVSGSCGCTGTLLSNSAIPPGGEGILKITFDPAKFKGKVEKAVSMKTNDTTDPNPHITFTATITQILEFGVSHVVVTTAVDSEQTAIVPVTNLSAVTVTISAVRAVPSDLAVSITPAVLKPGASGELRCTAKPGKPGIVKGDITLSTDHPLLPEIDIRYFLYAKAPAGKPAQTQGK